MEEQQRCLKARTQRPTYMQTMAALLQVGRTLATPQPWHAWRGPARTTQPPGVTYRCSLLSALLVAMPWVAPSAVAVTIEQCRAWAGCGARLKAAIVPTAKAATSNLVMVTLLWFHRYPCAAELSAAKGVQPVISANTATLPSHDLCR